MKAIWIVREMFGYNYTIVFIDGNEVTFADRIYDEKDWNKYDFGILDATKLVGHHLQIPVYEVDVPFVE